MYIVKLSHTDAISKVFGSLDGYHEIETLDEALSLRKQWIEEYPSSIEVKIFESNEVIVEDTIREKALQKKKDHINQLMEIKRNFPNAINIEINDDGSIYYEEKCK